MRSRKLLVLVLATTPLLMPLAAQAAIPFFGPIIPDAYKDCAAGWGLLMTVVNNTITLLITLAIVFVAPLMIAWAGFLFVINPVNPSKKEEAKAILTHTIVGIIVALSGWLIVDAIMAALYHPNDSAWGTWSTLVTSGGAPACLGQAGIQAGAGAGPVPAPPPVVVVPPSVCSIPPLTAITDPVAMQLESGQLLWPTNNPMLQRCANKFTRLVGGSPESAYRPQSYQNHLIEVKNKWCFQGLQSSTNPSCSQLKSTVSSEYNKHFQGRSAPCSVPVASVSNHSGGTAVDISGISQPSSMTVVQAAAQSCLRWYGNADPIHYDLDTTTGCTCN